MGGLDIACRAVHGDHEHLLSSPSLILPFIHLFASILRLWTIPPVLLFFIFPLLGFSFRLLPHHPFTRSLTPLSSHVPLLDFLSIRLFPAYIFLAFPAQLLNCPIFDNLPFSALFHSACSPFHVPGFSRFRSPFASSSLWVAGACEGVFGGLVLGVE